MTRIIIKNLANEEKLNKTEMKKVMGAISNEPTYKPMNHNIPIKAPIMEDIIIVRPEPPDYKPGLK